MTLKTQNIRGVIFSDPLGHLPDRAQAIQNDLKQFFTKMPALPLKFGQ
jgi:hypothetical protein